MFIINPKSKKMILTKGDNATFTVKAYQLDGTPRPIVSTDTVVFTVRASANAAASVISKTAVDGKVIIEPSDTSSLTPGLFVYDIQLTDADGDISTIIPESYFELRQEITR